MYDFDIFKFDLTRGRLSAVTNLLVKMFFSERDVKAEYNREHA